ncbi:MAG: hypothetical protein ACI3W8_04530 [Oscillospiraceae bacterium]
MVKTLLRLRMAGLLSWFTGAGRRKKASSGWKMAGFALLMLYALGALIFYIYFLFSMLAEPFAAAGLGWVYFALFTVMAFALMFIGSVFTAKAQLFEARDNELLLAMPIRPGQILLSRMAFLLIVNLLLGLVVALPAGFVWYRTGVWSAAGMGFFFLLLIALAFFAVAVSALFAWLLSLLTARIRRKSLFVTVFSLLFFALYFYVIQQANQFVLDLAAKGESLAAGLGAVAPLYWAGRAMAEGGLGFLLKAAVCLLLPFVLAYLLLSRSFLKAATAHRSMAKVRYQEKELRVSGLSRALYSREMSRFLSSSAYVVNAGLGALFTLVAAGAIVWKREDLLALAAMLPEELSPYLVPMLILALCLCAGMTTISAASISIEGHSLWVVRSLPVTAREALRAKLQVHFTVALPPVLLAELAAALVLRPTGLLLAALLLVPAAFTAVMGQLGLLLDLRGARFDWISETQAVKSNLSVLFSILIGWGLCLLPAIPALLMTLTARGLELLSMGYLALLLLLAWGLHHALRTWGCTRFAAL